MRNGFSWAASGWEFRAILRELESHLDEVRDQSIIATLRDPSGAAQVVDLIDLTDQHTWSAEDGKRVEEAIATAHRNILITKKWKTLKADQNVHELAFQALKYICLTGLRVSDTG